MTIINAFALVASALIYFLAVDEQSERDAEGRYVHRAMHHYVAGLYVGVVWLAAKLFAAVVNWTGVLA